MIVHKHNHIILGYILIFFPKEAKEVALRILLGRSFLSLGALKAKLWPKCLFCELKNERKRVELKNGTANTVGMMLYESLLRDKEVQNSLGSSDKKVCRHF